MQLNIVKYLRPNGKMDHETWDIEESFNIPDNYELSYEPIKGSLSIVTIADDTVDLFVDIVPDAKIKETMIRGLKNALG